MFRVIIIFLALGSFWLNASMVGQKALGFGVDSWVQKAGKTFNDVEDFKGKVLYIYGFQAWCPACHSHGFPTIQYLSEKFKDDDGVAFVAIQSVFEGFSFNTKDSAKSIIKKYSLEHIPVGHSGTPSKRSLFMRNYQSRGTPWIVVVDKEGIIRFSDFHETKENLERLIVHLSKL